VRRLVIVRQLEDTMTKGYSRSIFGMGGSLHNAEAKLAPERMFGVHIGIVTNNKHPEGEYMVKVRLPYFFDPNKDDSWWCRIGSSMAGKDRGMYLLPEPEDEVLVSFMNGDPNQPIIIGSLWNGKDVFPKKVKATPDDTELKIPNVDQGGKNNYRFFQSRSGHVMMFSDEEGKERISLRTKSSHELVLDDSSGGEKIQLYDKDNKQWLEIDVPGKKITLQTDTGDILIKAKNTITLDCKDLVIKTGKSIKVDSGTSTEFKAGSTWKQESGGVMDIKAGGVMNQKAPTINLN
jgi:uncharacterized protein involved in type VI secretion and phage assembly